MQLTSVQIVAMWVLPILFAVTVHEVAHGYVASLLGDKTARVLGRLTLNPVRHIDILGTIIVPFVLLLLNTGVILGWAKPVPVNANNFRSPKRDMVLVALAGPAANFLLAIIWAAVAKIGTILLVHDIAGALAIYSMGRAGISINLMLMILNLLPIPPLDGSHLVASVLPGRLSFWYAQLIPYGFFILLILLSLGVIRIIMNPIMNYLYRFVSNMFGLHF